MPEFIIESEMLGSTRWYWSIGTESGTAATENEARAMAAAAMIDAREKEDAK